MQALIWKLAFSITEIDQNITQVAAPDSSIEVDVIIKELFPKRMQLFKISNKSKHCIKHALEFLFSYSFPCQPPSSSSKHTNIFFSSYGDLGKCHLIFLYSFWFSMTWGLRECLQHVGPNIVV